MERATLILLGIAALIAAGYSRPDSDVEAKRTTDIATALDRVVRGEVPSREVRSKSSTSGSSSTSSSSSTSTSTTDESDVEDEGDEEDGISFLEALAAILTLGLGGTDCASSAVEQAIVGPREDLVESILTGVSCIISEFGQFLFVLITLSG